MHICTMFQKWFNYAKVSTKNYCPLQRWEVCQTWFFICSIFCRKIQFLWVWSKIFAPFAKNLSFSSKLTSEFEIIDSQVVNGIVSFQAQQKTLLVNRGTFGNILCSFLQQECSYSIERKNFASVLDNWYRVK